MPITIFLSMVWYCSIKTTIFKAGLRQTSETECARASHGARQPCVPYTTVLTLWNFVQTLSVHRILYCLLCHTHLADILWNRWKSNNFGRFLHAIAKLNIQLNYSIDWNFLLFILAIIICPSKMIYDIRGVFSLYCHALGVSTESSARGCFARYTYILLCEHFD